MESYLNYLTERDNNFIDETDRSVNGDIVTKHVKKPYYFPSNSSETKIRNAVTGIEYQWKVGSYDSLRLFKMVDSTGRYSSVGTRIKQSSSDYPNPNANHCYYDSPQQYMTHRKAKLDPLFVQQWEDRQNLFREKDVNKVSI